MSKMVCSEIGEINTFKALPNCPLVRDVVTAVRTDTIVYPHVSSCIGLVFELPASPHGIDRVGAHLVAYSPEYKGEGFDGAVKHYQENRILQQYCVNSNAYCFTPISQWKDYVLSMLRELRVSQYHFHVTAEEEVNAWVNQNNLSLTAWTVGSSVTAAQSLTPVGAATVINLNGVAWTQL